MGIHSDISRRHMLAMSAAAGGLAMSGFAASAQQPAKKIEQLDPALDKIISTSEPINYIAENMGGPLGPVEGPVWAEQSPTRSDPEGSSRNEFASGHAGLSLHFAA